MKAKGIKLHRIRWILDGLLLVAVILVVIARIQPTQAHAETQSSPQVILAESSQAFTDQPQVSGMDDVTQAITTSIPLDDITLAALMAAENAALTPPLYLTGLPIISH
ncbi:MAG TPA: hypothetical protein VLD65_02525 [Anaerolineales bacterium]|nr:hypothetical protein [Anaerolineales bacterium]